MGLKVEAKVTSDGLPMGLYDATVKSVSDPETKPDPFKEGENRTQFHVVLELSGNGIEDAIEQWFWINVPPRLMSEGFLSPKATLYKTMEAFGYHIDPELPLSIDTDEWVGKWCQALVEPTEDGKNTKITRLLQARKGRENGVKARLETPAPATNGKAAGGSPPYAKDLEKLLAAAGYALRDTGVVVGQPASWAKVNAWVEEFTLAFPEDDWMTSLVERITEHFKGDDAEVPFE